MKIVILSNKDHSGGAARAAYRLHKGLRMINQESSMVVMQKDLEDSSIIPVDLQKGTDEDAARKFLEIEKTYIQQNRTAISDSAFSLPYPGYDLSNMEVIRTADIINLHNIRSFQSVETIAHLLNLGKTVVWTLHDQSAFTGGCSYSAGCEGYQDECRNCPQLRYDPFQVPYVVLQNKLRLLKKPNLALITPSRWLKDLAQSSKLFSTTPIKVIYNSVDSDLFVPQKKTEAKLALGIPDNPITLLLEVRKRKRKGWAQMVQALSWCLDNPRFKCLVENKKILLLTFGGQIREFKALEIPQRHLGRIASDDTLSTLYSAADLFVLPSLEDNFPNTMLEAMACGTPVVAFQTGGIPELVTDGVNGRLAPCGDTAQLGNAMLDLILNDDECQRLRSNCRPLIEKQYPLEVQAQKYLTFFERMLQNFPAMNRPHDVSLKQGQASLTCTIDGTIDKNLLPLFAYYEKK